MMTQYFYYKTSATTTKTSNYCYYCKVPLNKPTSSDLLTPVQTGLAKKTVAENSLESQMPFL